MPKKVKTAVTKANVGDLRVWWIPQVPMKSFFVTVVSVEEGVKVMRTLADYDRFQFENNVKPDYCNAGGLEVYTSNVDGDGNPGWEAWFDEETGEDDPEMWLLSAQREPA